MLLISVIVSMHLLDGSGDDEDFDWDNFKAALAMENASAGASLEEIVNMSDEDVVKHSEVSNKDRSISASKVKSFVEKWAGEMAEQLTTKKARIAWMLAKLIEGQ